MMIRNLRLTTALLFAGVTVLLSSCGVGNDKDEAGSLTAFNLSHNEINITGPVGACPGAINGNVGRVYVFGGTAPYDVFSTDPAGVVPSPSKVEHPEGFFELTVTGGGCFKIVVVVVDKLGRQQTLTVNGVKGA